jgi:hypothetical protein
MDSRPRSDFEIHRRDGGVPEAKLGPTQRYQIIEDENTPAQLLLNLEQPGLQLRSAPLFAHPPNFLMQCPNRDGTEVKGAPSAPRNPFAVALRSRALGRHGRHGGVAEESQKLIFRRRLGLRAQNVTLRTFCACGRRPGGRCTVSAFATAASFTRISYLGSPARRSAAAPFQPGVAISRISPSQPERPSLLSCST